MTIDLDDFAGALRVIPDPRAKSSTSSDRSSDGFDSEFHSTTSPSSSSSHNEEIDFKTFSSLDHASKQMKPLCPAAGSGRANAEFESIRKACPVLRSTGCTAEFCQAGRMIKTDEHRVGRDRDEKQVREEALDFLRQLRNDGIIETDRDLASRRHEILHQVHGTSRLYASSAPWPQEAQKVRECSTSTDHMVAGGVWHQTSEELKHGVRLAWKNSSKCIMRSEASTLELCDLRHVTSSCDMGTTLIEHMKKAFNNGKIVPTVCVFPPRYPDQRGPMIWNGQLLSFAGYQNDDDTILGDPANVALTEAIIELGWKPPQIRTQWDLLPLVTMAEGDRPHITEVRECDFPLVRISHPHHELAFEKLGLRWVPAPALSQLGFDVGGVQYTATPFMGWFMDAEIGVRNLADTFRYNMLPKVAVELGYVEDEASLDRAPEHERMAYLSKAQAELTYAVFHSFKEAGVMMSDTLTASSMYCNFDDEHFREKGHRLPSNPYWLAPPQGSIVPIWHRGGAPNYQPTPLICRNFQNPIKAWQREVREMNARRKDSVADYSADCQESGPSSEEHAQDPKSQECPRRVIHVHYCTSANTARKLAVELRRSLSESGADGSTTKDAKILNELRMDSIDEDDVVLIIASTSGNGEMPANGAKLIKDLAASSRELNFKFAIFGNGSTLYHDTYNAAAKQIHQALQRRGAKPITAGLFMADTAVNDPPWEHFEQWLEDIQHELGFVEETQPKRGSTQQNQNQWKSSIFDVASQFRSAQLVSTSGEKQSGIQHVTLDVGGLQYEPLSHVEIIPPNDEKDVRAALKSLRLKGGEKLQACDDMTAATFLRDFVDFDMPFASIGWADPSRITEPREAFLKRTALRDVLRAMSRILTSRVFLEELFASMPLKTPRTYSTACSQQLLGSNRKVMHLELLIQSRHHGLVSSYFTNSAPGSAVRLRLHETKWSTLLEDFTKPVICFATGSGLAPIRSLLQHRLHLAQSSNPDQHNQQPGPVSLILGYRPTDCQTITSALQGPIRAGVVDICLFTPSNPEKVRAQDQMFKPSVRDSIVRKIKDQQAGILICASSQAADDFEKNLQALIGCDIRAAIGERYVKEVFSTGAHGTARK